MSATALLVRDQSISPLMGRIGDLAGRIEDAEYQADCMRQERDELIRKALAEGVTQAVIAEATGLTQPRIAQIKKGMA